MTQLSDEELVFCQLYAEGDKTDPIGAFLKAFRDAQHVPPRYLGTIVSELLARDSIRLEIYVQDRMLEEHAALIRELRNLRAQLLSFRVIQRDDQEGRDGDAEPQKLIAPTLH